MDKCLECQQECEREWYMPTTHGGIYPFCSEKCADTYTDREIDQGKLLTPEQAGIKATWISEHECVIDTGTNES